MMQQIYRHLAIHSKLPMKNAYQSGTTIMTDEECDPAGSQIIWTFDKHVIIRTHPQFEAQFKALIEEGQALSLAKIVENSDVTVEEQDNLYSITEADFIAHDSDYIIRQLTQDDAEAFARFQGKCSERDRQYGEVGLNDEAIFSVLDGERIIAAASSFEWYGFVDIGVLTDPAYRGQGVGKAVVAAITTHYLQNKMDTRPLSYRHETSNIGSGKIAKAVGWQHFATLDFIRFKEIETT